MTAPRIVIVDDYPDDRLLEARLLKKALKGATIIQVEGPATWARVLADGEFDIVVSDYNLGWTDGVTVTRAVKSRWPDKPVIIATGTGTEEIAVDAMKAGADDYVLKGHSRIGRLPIAVSGALERAAARALDRRAHATLEAEIAERASVRAALGRIHAEATPEATAELVCGEVLRALDLDFAALNWFLSESTLILALRAPGPAPLRAGQIAPAERTLYLRERAARGPWIDEWSEDVLEDPYIKAWHDAGYGVGAYVPLVRDEKIHGVLVGALSSRGAVEEIVRRLPMLVEFAALATLLIEPAMRARSEASAQASVIRSTISSGAFRTVFQPIVELRDGAVAGFEALTRFADDIGPAVHFAAAREAAVGVELEMATLGSAMRAARDLPAGAFVSLNVSAELMFAVSDLAPVVATFDRPVVLELTEHEAGVDIPRLREVLQELGEGIRLAVDDTGAGYAGLQRVLELRPQFVKLDIGLVRNLDRDPARTALIAGMVHFSRELGCSLIAEGVERRGEERALRVLGVPLGQGHLFGRPAPAGAWASRADRETAAKAPG